MYSRKTGIMYNPTQTQRKIEDFNKNLREQYQSRGFSHSNNIHKDMEVKSKENNTAISNKALDEILNNENIVILSLLSLLLLEKNRDYALIGVLAILLFLK